MGLCASHRKVDADIIDCLPIRFEEKKVKKNKIKRFCKWACSRISKNTTSQQRQTKVDSRPQPQRSIESTSGSSLSSVHDAGEGALSEEQVVTNIQTCKSNGWSFDETEKHRDTDSSSVYSWRSCVSVLSPVQDVEEDIPNEEQEVMSSTHSVSSPQTHSDGPVLPMTKSNIVSVVEDLAWKTEEEVSDLSLKGRTADITDHYRVGQCLGEGAFGVVFEAIRLSDSRKVAIKYVEKVKWIKFRRIRLFKKDLPAEVAVMILVNQGPSVPQLIRMLDWYETPDHYMLVLERPTPCESLHEFLMRHGGRISERTARDVMRQVVIAARICCERGVFHRDITLKNLLINQHTKQVKLIDFGCGDLLKKSAYKILIGTRLYFPPEATQPKARYHGKPSTVWSLGILLFKMVCGHFPREQELPVIYKKGFCKRGVSDEFSDLVCSCLQFKPQDRIHLEKILLHDWFQKLILD